MTVRINLKCETCNKAYIFRVCIGYGNNQKHSYLCEECGEAICISLDLNQEQGSYEVNYEDNAIESDSTTGRIVNMHPEFIVPHDALHVDYISINILASQQMMKKNAGKTLPSLTKTEYENMRQGYNSIFVQEEEWGFLKKAWSQLAKGNTKQAKILTQKSKNFLEKPDESLESWIFSFAIRSLTYKKAILFDDILPIISEIQKKDGKAFQDFLKYHNDTILPNNIKKIYKVFEDFYKSYQDFSQYYLSYKREGVVQSGAVSSCSFSETKRFYGDAFEILGSGIETFACLSNLYKSRSYDTFEKISLAAYRSSDKSKRGECFKDIPEFSILLENYDSAIRNGSHHATFELDYHRMIVKYIPRKSLVVEEISYHDYIDCCVSLFFSSVTLIAVDLYLNNLYKTLTK